MKLGLFLGQPVLSLFLALFLPATLALPIPADGRPFVSKFSFKSSGGHPKDLEVSMSVNPGVNRRCTGKSSLRDTDPSSPFVQDCIAIADKITKGGFWQVAYGKKVEFIRNKSCILTVEFRDQVSNSYMRWGEALPTPKVAVGNWDLIDIITTSAAQYTSPGGRMGAKGTMKCDDGYPSKIHGDWSPRIVLVNWAIHGAI